MKPTKEEETVQILKKIVCQNGEKTGLLDNLELAKYLSFQESAREELEKRIDKINERLCIIKRQIADIPSPSIEKIEMYGDDISREWIYMLEDKLVYDDSGDVNEKIIKHSDFKEVVVEWEKLLKEVKPDKTDGTITTSLPDWEEQFDRKFPEILNTMDVCPKDGENKGYDKTHYCLKHDTETLIIPACGKEIKQFIRETINQEAKKWEGMCSDYWEQGYEQGKGEMKEAGRLNLGKAK